MIDMLAALHQSSPESARLSPRPAKVPYRDVLEPEIDAVRPRDLTLAPAAG